ncbi:hypothetical protein DFH29DRAFT_382941 [Suillus ampliporus]|nr:hypothetical protein DFH29DRAFT_382941 [Suillus ampliporus]
MMAIGTGNSTELWLGFCPISNVEDITLANESPLLSEKHGDTRLTSIRYRMAVMFLAFVLAKIPALPIHVMHPYGTHEDFHQWKLDDATNVCAQRTISLRLQDAIALDHLIKSEWDDWVADAPSHWTADGWLQQHAPLSIACRYGQNQPIASSDQHALRVEARNWNMERDYTHIRYLSMAVATDIGCFPVRKWRPIPVDEILSVHDFLYDSPDYDVRQPIDLPSLPPRDPATNKEINIYDEDGRRVPRFIGVAAPGTKPCGLLVNLETIPQLFSSYVGHDEHLDIDADIIDLDDVHDTKINVYPQAFLRKYGHVQAKSVLPHFRPFVNKVQSRITRARHAPSHDADDDDDDEDVVVADVPSHDSQPIAPAILASACQFYNEISHRVRPSAALHDVQQGRITSALAGTYAQGAAKHVHSACMHTCNVGLPHKRYDDKIKLSNVPRALRLENIYILQLDSMIPSKRNGNSIYIDVVVPLSRAWSHPHVADALRPHLAVFAAHAFPQVYQWMTFGITSLLERIWEHQKPLINQGTKPSPQMIEICAMLERALAYAHTGNAKVLSSSLMKPFWLIRSLLEQGLPTFSSIIHLQATTTRPVTVLPAQWPVVTAFNVPAMASNRCQILTYGKDHFEAYKAEFHIQLSVNNPSPSMFGQYEPDLRHAIIIAVVAFQAYIIDVKTLVSVAVIKLCNELDDNDTHSSIMESKTRRYNLKKWLACSDPLCYGDKAYEYLLRCIIGDPTEYFLGFPNPTKLKLSIRDFAKLICEMSRETKPTPLAAPLYSSGCAPMIFKVALLYMSKYAPRHSPTAADTFLQNALIVAANHLHINNVPWHLPATRGRRPRKPNHQSWINLGKASTIASIKRLNSQIIDEAEQASQRAQASDSRAPWAVESITLQSLPDFITRAVPPDEFCIENVSLDKSEPKDSIIRKTYEWAFAEFDMDVPLHQLALLIGIYVSKLIPNLFHDVDDRPYVKSYATAWDFTAAIRAMPWKPNTSRKGSKVASHFVAMVPVYIMAIIDESSPLHDYLKSARSFPTAWNKKHSHKGMSALLLARVGLAEARTGRIFNGGIFDIDWAVLNPPGVTKYHLKLFSMLADREFGPFRVAQSLFGTVAAREIARSTHTFIVNPGLASTSLGKRSESSGVDVDDDDVSSVAPVKRRRVKH